MARKKVKGLSFYQPKKRVSSSVFYEIFICIVWMVIAAFLAGVLVYFYGMKTYVVGSSMEPVLYSGQTILMDRFAYVLGKPKVGDIVIFLPKGNEKSHYYVKRVVAGPGDMVQIRDGVLYVNGEVSEFAPEGITEPGIAKNPLILDNGQYFCIGENPQDGEDSRHANIGPVSKTDIVGRAWFHLSHGEEPMGFVQ